MRTQLSTGAVLAALALAGAAAAAGPTFIVNSSAALPGGGNLADGVCETGPGTGVCTLPAAVMEANAIAGGGATIVLPPGVYPSFPPLVQSTTIEGETASSSVVTGFGRVRAESGTQRLAHLGISLQHRNGGAVENAEGAILTLDDVVVADNAACYEGDTSLGIVNAGDLTLRHAIVRNNGSGCSWGHNLAGGLLNEVGATARIEDSLFAGNHSEWGGAIGNQGTLVIERTSILQNTVIHEGGGIHNTGTLDLVNVTLSGNGMVFSYADADGGGLFSKAGETRIVATTISENTAGGAETPGGDGGGIYLDGTATLLLTGSLVADNSIDDGVPDECGGPVAPVSGDFLVIAARATCSLEGALDHVNASDVDAGLGPLAALGGFAPVQAASAGIRAIPAASCLDPDGGPLAVDGRGYARAGDCDIGALQSGAGYAPAALDGRELLRNGGAAGNELGQAWAVANEGPPPPWTWRIAPPPYWVEELGSLRQVLYGSPDLPARADAPAGSGAYLFAAGRTSLSRSSQAIDLSAHATAIDAGNVPFRAAGAFGGAGVQEDEATMTVTFRDSGGGPLDERTLGGFGAAERGGVTKLLADVETGLVPAGTRSVVVAVTAQRETAAPADSNDGYADALSLTVPEPTTAAVTALATIAILGSGRTWRRTLRRSGR